MNDVYTIADASKLLNKPAGDLWARVLMADIPTIVRDGKRVIPKTVMNELLGKTDDEEDEELISVLDAAKYLGVSEMRIHQMIDAGAIPSRRIGKRKFVVRSKNYARA